MNRQLEWVNSGGGPLVAVPAEIAPNWRGIEGSRASSVGGMDETDESDSDYDRACGIDGYLGTLDLGPGRALVLGDEPMQTAFIPRPTGGVLVRWMYAENEDSIRRAVEVVPESLWEATPHRMGIGPEGILVFDSAYPGDALPTPSGDGAITNSIHIEIPAGTYRVDTADYEPDDSTRLILHRLRREDPEALDGAPLSG